MGSNLVYARIINEGGRTKAHEIRPRNKQALAFGGRGPFGKVNHPGSNIPARRFLGLSAENLREIETAILTYYKGRLDE